MTFNPQIQASKHQVHSPAFSHDNVMSCLEHQRLTRSDFTHPEDFDYLIEQDLPCFLIEVKWGQLCLLVSHYLAKVVLPSGISLEILPKITPVVPPETALRETPSRKKTRKKSREKQAVLAKDSQATDEVQRSRRWVAKMISDIANEALGKLLPAVSLDRNTDNTGGLNQSSMASAIMPCFYSEQLIANAKALQLRDSQQTIHLSQRPYPKHNSNNINNNMNITNIGINQPPWYEGLLTIATDSIYQAAAIIPNSYQTTTSNHPKAQGKLKLKAQLTSNAHRPHYFYGEQAVFKANTALTDFLFSAWQQLQRLTNTQFQQTPESLLGGRVLNDSQCQRVYQAWLGRTSKWHNQLTPIQKKVLSQGIEWAWWLLTNGSNPIANLDIHNRGDSGNRGDSESSGVVDIEQSHTQTAVPAIMINMNHAFERWVLLKLAAMVNRTLPDSKLLIQPKFDWLYTLQDITQKDTQRKPLQSAMDSSQSADRSCDMQHHSVIQRLKPDACIVDSDGQISHVIDVKYKAINKIQEISGTDWQQLYVYQHHLSSLHAWLIFPMAAGLDKGRYIGELNLKHEQENEQTAQKQGEGMTVIAFDVNQGKLLV